MDGEEVILSGWVQKKRDHGNVLFLDLRDHYGITQCVIQNDNPSFNLIEKTSLETVVRVSGVASKRSVETINKDLLTGEIEIKVSNFEILSYCKELPMPVFSDQDYAEDIRLKYRFLDLRRKILGLAKDFLTRRGDFFGRVEVLEPTQIVKKMLSDLILK